MPYTELDDPKMNLFTPVFTAASNRFRVPVMFTSW